MPEMPIAEWSEYSEVRTLYLFLQFQSVPFHLIKFQIIFLRSLWFALLTWSFMQTMAFNS